MKPLLKGNHDQAHVVHPPGHLARWRLHRRRDPDGRWASDTRDGSCCLPQVVRKN